MALHIYDGARVKQKNNFLHNCFLERVNENVFTGLQMRRMEGNFFLLSNHSRRRVNKVFVYPTIPKGV